MKLRKADAAFDVALFVVSMLNGVWWSTPIMKSWGWRRGVWLGLGYQVQWSPPITRTWLTTVLPPYMRGVGLNLSLGHNSLRIGVYKVLGNFNYHDYDDVDVDGELAILEGLGWRSGVDEGEEIGTWQRPQSGPEASLTLLSEPEFEPSSSTTSGSTSGPRLSR